MRIKTLIRESRISSQHQLLPILSQEGWPITQATLSRDLRQLNAVKVQDDDTGYYYHIPSDDNAELQEEKAYGPMSAFLGMEFSANLAVIKTRPAFAPSIASFIDRLSIYGILGTIAGDDNILLVMREGTRPADIRSAFIAELPELKTKLQ